MAYWVSERKPDNVLRLKAKKTFNRILPAVVLAVVMTAGCISLEKTYPQKYQYLLQPNLPAYEAVDPAPPVVVVKDFEVAPLNQTNSFIYRYDDARITTDYAREFLAPVSTMITDIFKEALIRSGRFSAPGAGTAPSPLFFVSGKILQLVADFRESDAAPTATIEIRLVVESRHSGRRELLFSKSYREDRTAADASARSLVRAWNLGLETLLQRSMGDLIEASANPVTTR